MYDHLVDDLSRQQREADAAAYGLELIEQEPVATCDRVAVDRGLREARAGTADADAIVLIKSALTGRCGTDVDAGDALQSVGNILVGQFADILRADNFDNRVRAAFSLERLLQRKPDAGHDHFLQRRILIGGRLVATRLCMNYRIAPEQSHGDCRSDQRRPCDSHD